jgi:Zn/Cd-binding protein ZinT
MDAGSAFYWSTRSKLGLPDNRPTVALFGTDCRSSSFHGHDVTEGEMPAKSKAQQKAAGAALSAKRGEQKVSELKGASKSMYKSMSEGELDKMASTKRKKKPQHVAKKK